MITLALVVVAVALAGLLVAALRAQRAAGETILVLGATHRRLQPALVLARDDARRAGVLRAPDRHS